jgi:hypothetical protein
MLEAGYRIQFNEEMKIAGVMEVAGKKYLDTIQAEICMIMKAGGMAMYNYLIQAIMQSFRIYGNVESKNDSESETVLSVVGFRGNCNICGKQGHKASECP